MSILPYSVKTLILNSYTGNLADTLKQLRYQTWVLVDTEGLMFFIHIIMFYFTGYIK